MLKIWKSLFVNDEPPALPVDQEYVFAVHERVYKFTGDYQWAGVVVSRFRTLKGAERYVVSHPADKGEVLHIYSPSNLKRAEPPVTLTSSVFSA